LLVAQLVVVEQRVIGLRREEVFQPGGAAGVDGLQLLEVLAPKIRQRLAGILKGVGSCRRPGAGPFVDGVAEEDEEVVVF
jgi:hypothetical protein